MVEMRLTRDELGQVAGCVAGTADQRPHRPERAVRFRELNGGAVAEAIGPGRASRLALPETPLTGELRVDAGALISAHEIAVHAELREIQIIGTGAGTRVSLGAAEIDATPPVGSMPSLVRAFPSCDADDIELRADRTDMLMLLEAAKRRPSGLDRDSTATVLFTVSRDRMELGLRWAGGPLVLAWCSCEASAAGEGAVNPYELFEAVLASPTDTVHLELGRDNRRPWVLRSGDFTTSLWAAPVGIEIYRPDFEALVSHFHDAQAVGPFGPDVDGDYLLRRVQGRDVYARLDPGADRWGTDAMVQLFVVLATLPRSPELLSELNDLNAAFRFGRLFWVRGQVLVETERLLEGLSREELMLMLERLETGAIRVSPMLEAVFGGSDTPEDKQ